MRRRRRRRSCYPPRRAAAARPAEVEGVSDVGDYRVVSRPLVCRARTSRDGTFDPLAEPVARGGRLRPVRQAEASVSRTINRVRLFLAFGVLGGTLLAFLGGLVRGPARDAPDRRASPGPRARWPARATPTCTLPKPRANDEVSDLAHTLEDMLRELGAARGETEATLDRQRDFVADASHELRTPLTSILANLELLEAELDGEQREMADSALRSSQRMRRLVGDLLLLARADAGPRGAAARPSTSPPWRARPPREAGALSVRPPAVARRARARSSVDGRGRRPPPPGGQPGRERADPHAARARR